VPCEGVEDVIKAKERTDRSTLDSCNSLADATEREARETWSGFMTENSILIV